MAIPSTGRDRTQELNDFFRVELRGPSSEQGNTLQTAGQQNAYCGLSEQEAQATWVYPFLTERFWKSTPKDEIPQDIKNISH